MAAMDCGGLCDGSDGFATYASIRDLSPATPPAAEELEAITADTEAMMAAALTAPFRPARQGSGRAKAAASPHLPEKTRRK